MFGGEPASDQTSASWSQTHDDRRRLMRAFAYSQRRFPSLSGRASIKSSKSGFVARGRHSENGPPRQLAVGIGILEQRRRHRTRFGAPFLVGIDIESPGEPIFERLDLQCSGAALSAGGSAFGIGANLTPGLRPETAPPRPRQPSADPRRATQSRWSTSDPRRSCCLRLSETRPGGPRQSRPTAWRRE